MGALPFSVASGRSRLDRDGIDAKALNVPIKPGLKLMTVIHPAGTDPEEISPHGEIISVRGSTPKTKNELAVLR